MRAVTILGAMALTAAAVACAPRPDPVAEGRTFYQEYCSGCHGTQGRGDGPAAEGLDPAPADLTAIAARNGGTFPAVEVMATIDGYGLRGHADVMPVFDPLLQGPRVMFETDDGVMTPTPRRLVALAAYLETLQG